MKIEVWSDFVCPFCYIGKRHLEMALQQLGLTGEDVEVVNRSFELDPKSNPKPGATIHEMMAAKFGTSEEQAKQMHANMKQRAAQAGLTYNYDQMVPANTFNAHRLEHLAAESGHQQEMVERLFKAYFTDSLNINDPDTLAKLAGEVGLAVDQAKAVLAGEQYADAVRQDEREAYQLGVQGVPFFVIDRKYGLSGAQPVEVFVQALQEARGTGERAR